MGQGLVRAAAGAVAVAVLVVVAWVLWPGSSAVSVPRARQYLDVSACLLTGPGGITPGTAGGRVWRAMESASLASHVMVSYLPDAGPADAPVLLSTLAERRCGVIVVTDASRAQVVSVARANPGRRYVLVTASAAAGPAVVPSNAVVVPVAGASGLVDQEITALAGTA